MKTFLTGLSAIAAVALFAGPAAAQGARGETGFYVRGSLGYSWSAEDEVDYSPLWGIGAGYRLAPNIRADLAADWRDRYIVEGARGFAGGQEFDSQVDNRTIMLNGFYDFAPMSVRGIEQTIRPYLGAGVGFSSTSVDDVVVVIPDQNRFERFFGDDDDQFAWQLMAGLRFETGPGVFFDLGYRYADLGDIGLTSTIGTIDNELSAHELVASLGYRF